MPNRENNIEISEGNNIPEDELVKPISIEIARQTISERAPDLDIHGVTYLGGGSYSAFGVNGQIIYKFPKVQDDTQSFDDFQNQFEREQAILPIVAEYTKPHDILTPLDMLPPSESFRGPVFSYRMFSGEQLAKLSLQGEQRLRVARMLGDFLSKLHAIDIARFPDKYVKVVSPEELKEGWYSNYEAVKTKAFDLLTPDERAWATQHYESFLAGADRIQPQIALTHGDFGDENVLLPEEGDRLQIIDFEDVGVGAAVADFCTWLTKGEDFVEQMLDAYTFDTDEDFMRQIKFYFGRLPFIYFSFAVDSGNKSFIDFGRQKLEKTRNILD